MIFDRLKKLVHERSGLLIIILMAALIEVSNVIQYMYASHGIREEVQHRAESELRIKNLEVEKVMTEVEVAVRNMVWAVEQRLNQPDSMYAITRELLAQNDIIVGSAVAFEPYYYVSKGKQFSPYSYKHDRQILSKQLGTENYQYHKMEWYTISRQTGEGHWSEPYFDEGGGEMLMSTYSLPVRDSQRKIVAIFTADVSLNWLAEVLNAHHIYHSSYNVMVSREGRVMACPVESLTMRSTLEEATANMDDTATLRINRDMLAGKNGHSEVTNEQGQRNYVFYGPIGKDTGWSMAVVCADKEIYHDLRQKTTNLMLLMLAGLALLGYIIWRTARNHRRMQQVNAEKERIAGELHIASAIQMGMLPKTFPPYPDRDDVVIYGTLVSAKEVGGDLYDFYIRNEKLFFAIGDVSGKGIPASLVMAVTRSIFRSVSAHEAAPDRIVTLMNNSMAEMNETNMFVTLFVGVLDLPTGRLRYCNAGHCAPVLVGSSVKQLPVEPNLPVGIFPDMKFVAQETMIDKQTTIFLYTDGLTEAENSAHEEFGNERMMAVTKSIQSNPSPQTIINQMNEAVRQFVDGNEQSDDLTMLAVQYTLTQHNSVLQRNITLPNDISETPQLAEFVDSVCEALHFDQATIMKMNLAIEEAVVNVMNYAYPKGEHGDVNIEAVANDQRLKFTITDSGAPFDPTSRDEVDTTLSAEERPIGGLGIHLIRQIMDSINYERTDGKNVLTLRKKLK